MAKIVPIILGVMIVFSALAMGQIDFWVWVKNQLLPPLYHDGQVNIKRN